MKDKVNMRIYNLDVHEFKLLIIAFRTAAGQAQEDINLTTGNITLVKYNTYYNFSLLN